MIFNDNFQWLQDVIYNSYIYLASLAEAPVTLSNDETSVVCPFLHSSHHSSYSFLEYWSDYNETCTQQWVFTQNGAEGRPTHGRLER